MIEVAPDALADVDAGPRAGFTRFVRREPLGVVFIVAPWNYPYLTAVNGVVPALMAGNAVILKHSAQTPLCAERFAAAFKAAGLPKGLFQHLHMSHDDTLKLIGTDGIDYVNFTGSVPAGHAVVQAAAERFIGLGLELGGCDPAYVRADANLPHAIENLVDGAMFNSGQSCCGIQRIYVHQDVHQQFLDGFVELTNQYRLGNPLESGDQSRPGRARQRRRGDPQAGGQGHAPGRQAADRSQALRGRQEGHRLRRAPGLQGRQQQQPGDAGGMLRPGRRHHEGEERRRRRPPYERQRVRPHRRHLDRRTRRPPSTSATASTPAPGS